MADEKTTPELQLPGFRFHPTEEELLDYYLRSRAFAKNRRVDIIGFLNIYHHAPWDLPGLAKIGEREWYFFVPRNRKQGHGGRPNRTTEHGFWKATGSDRQLRSLKDPKRIIGLKKTLVFYMGRAPRGSKTDWVMNEYRMPDDCALPKEDVVLCKIYRKATSLKVLEQQAMVMEEEMKTLDDASQCSTLDTASIGEDDNLMNMSQFANGVECKVEKEEQVEDIFEEKRDISTATSSLRSSTAIPELQLPKANMDWMKDPFFTQLHSPWLVDFLWTPHANVLNF